MPEQADNKNQKLIASFIVILAVVLIAVGVSMFAKKEDTPTANTQTSDVSAADNSSTDTTPPTDATYKDGTYTADGTYTSPGGTEKISVNVTLKDGIVTDTKVEQEASTPDGAEFQSAFRQGYKSLVVGKALDSIHISHVSGSSLTSRGFTNALEQIKDQAQR